MTSASGWPKSNLTPAGVAAPVGYRAAHARVATANEKEKARRRLENLTRSGLLAVVDEGDKALNKPRLWGAA